MKFQFEKFGYVDKGTVELGDLTIICGPNNVGKTYVSYSIYGFISNLKSLIKLKSNRAKGLGGGVEFFTFLRPSFFWVLAKTLIEGNIFRASQKRPLGRSRARSKK